jgi:tetrahydromethanopterin S-methyltransferase subunit H
MTVNVCMMWKDPPLFKTQTEPTAFKIGGVTVGGRLGENPTILIGSIFYHRHKIVEDAATGVFDRMRAEALINHQDELADKTGNPCMIDLVCASTAVLPKYLDFVASSTDAPILMDGITASINMSGLDYAREWGLLDRIVYNSLTLRYEPTELEKIREVGLESAVLLALNTKDFTGRGRVTAIDGLLLVAKEAGIRMPLIDTCVLDIATLGQACWALSTLKTKYGLPVGCGPHNATSSAAKRLKAKYGPQSVKLCTASANVMTAAVGADFILYGPIETADAVFPIVGMVDAANGQIIMDTGVTLERSHPRFRILR